MRPYHCSFYIVGAAILLPLPGVDGIAGSAILFGSAAVVDRPAPDCAHPQNREESLWCRALPPDPVRERPVIQAALDRMSAAGGVCRSLALLTTELLDRQRIRLFDQAEYQAAAGAAPLGGGVRSYMLLSRAMVLNYQDALHRSANVDSRGQPRPETLQLVLAHEADHLRGLDHVDEDGYLTPNALRCSDLL